MNYEPRNSIPTLFKDGLVPIALNSFMQKKPGLSLGRIPIPKTFVHNLS